MKPKINKIQIIKSVISLFGIFLFNLPTLAAFDINYGNLFVIPTIAQAIVQAVPVSTSYPETPGGIDLAEPISIPSPTEAPDGIDLAEPISLPLPTETPD